MLVKIKSGEHKNLELILHTYRVVGMHPPVSVRPKPTLYMGEVGDTPLLQYPKGSDMPEWANVGDFFEVAICQTPILMS